MPAVGMAAATVESGIVEFAFTVNVLPVGVAGAESFAGDFFPVGVAGAESFRADLFPVGVADSFRADFFPVDVFPAGSFAVADCAPAVRPSRPGRVVRAIRTSRSTLG
jgi:hypothetical protein